MKLRRLKLDERHSSKGQSDLIANLDDLGLLERVAPGNQYQSGIAFLALAELLERHQRRLASLEESYGLLVPPRSIHPDPPVEDTPAGRRVDEVLCRANPQDASARSLTPLPTLASAVLLVGLAKAELTQVQLPNSFQAQDFHERAQKYLSQARHYLDRLQELVGDEDE